MSDVLYVAARAPRPGFTKTRLGQAIGHEQAAALYVAFLRDLAARFAHAPFPVGWYVTPEDAWDDLAPLVLGTNGRGGEGGIGLDADAHGARDGGVGTNSGAGENGARGRCPPVIVQGPGDWGARQQALFRTATARGESRTILVASDSPQLEVEVVAEAFALLDVHDLVLGPTIDGGYYLMGMRRPCDVLGSVRMSTGTVLSEIVARAERLGLSVGLVPPTFDVDDADDLDRLAEVAWARNDLVATRAVLEQLGRLMPAERVRFAPASRQLVPHTPSRPVVS